MDFIWGNIVIGSFFAIIGGYLIKGPDNPDEFGYIMQDPFKNKDAKVEANKFSGRILIIGGIISILLGLLLNLLFSVDHLSNDKLTGINFFAVIITSMIVGVTTTLLTEDHLKKTFDKEGNKRKILKAISTDLESD